MSEFAPSSGSDEKASSSNATREHLDNLAGEAHATLNDLKQEGTETYEHYRDLAAEQIDSIADSAQAAVSAFQEKDTLGISGYLAQLADGLGTFAKQVREKSAEDLLHQGANLARDNPAVFLAGSIAIGFGLSRVLRAHAPSAQEPSSYPSAPPPRPSDEKARLQPALTGEAAWPEDSVEPLDAPSALPGTISTTTGSTPPGSTLDKGGL